MVLGAFNSVSQTNSGDFTNGFQRFMIRHYGKAFELFAGFSAKKNTRVLFY